MERKAAQRIPDWILNARDQVKLLEIQGKVSFEGLQFQWKDATFQIGPLAASITLNRENTTLDFRSWIGAVTDTSGVAEIFDELPFEGVDLEYELAPESSVFVNMSLSLTDSTTASEILNFIRQSSMVSIMGLQSLINLGNLRFPPTDLLDHFQLGPGQANWGNPGVASDLLLK
jgi:hypothetical protein